MGLLSPYVDAKVMNIFLQQFSQQLCADVQAVLVWDQAGFHKSGELCAPENITILELPAYSPELNRLRICGNTFAVIIGRIAPTMIMMTCDSLLVRHGKQFFLNRPLSVAYATALMLSAKIYYDWY